MVTKTPTKVVVSKTKSVKTPVPAQKKTLNALAKPKPVKLEAKVETKAVKPTKAVTPITAKKTVPSKKVVVKPIEKTVKPVSTTDMLDKMKESISRSLQ